MSGGGKNRSIKELLNEFIYGSEMQVVKRKDLTKILKKHSDSSRTKPTRLDSLKSKKFYKKLSDRLNQTHVWSEAMGDAYTDSQHINDGMMTVESGDIPLRMYSINKIRDRSNKKDSSVALFQ